jgi:hypothetical protein
MTLAERVIYLIIALIIFIGMIIARVDRDFLEAYYLAEDGILEWLTVIIILFCAFLCFRRATCLRSIRPKVFLLSLVFIGFGFLFCAGEELSWGQRIFSIDTPEWLKERNQQHEINVHNLMVGEISINKVIFGKILSISLALYLFVLPLLTNRFTRIRHLADRFALPLPTLTQAICFLPALIVPDLVIESGETDELREACGFLMFVILFCFPKNCYIFSPDWRMTQEKKQ